MNKASIERYTFRYCAVFSKPHDAQLTGEHDSGDEISFAYLKDNCDAPSVDDPRRAI